MRPNAHTRIAHASCPDPTWALAWRCQCLHSAPINKYAYHTCANLIRVCLISIYYTCIYERSELYKSEAYIEQVGHGRHAYAILHTLWSRSDHLLRVTPWPRAPPTVIPTYQEHGRGADVRYQQQLTSAVCGFFNHAAGRLLGHIML